MRVEMAAITKTATIILLANIHTNYRLFNLSWLPTKYETHFNMEGSVEFKLKFKDEFYTSKTNLRIE
jgi:hypothetical protein